MYIDLKERKKIKQKYYPLYIKYNKGLRKVFKKKFIKKYENIDNIINNHNQMWLKDMISQNSFLNNINGYKLDNCQKEVVLAEEKNTLVLAGAGSGKTLTIVAKVAYLLKQGILGNEILCLSFTNASTNDLNKKLKNYGVRALTFHKLASKIMRHYGYNYKIVKENVLLKIIDKEVTYYKVKDLVNINFITLNNSKDIRNMHNLVFKESLVYHYFRKNIVSFINLFKNQNYHINKFNELIRKSSSKRIKKYLWLIKKIYIKYMAYLEENNMIDFNDMINKGANLVRKYGYDSYKYIIVDEYQDTSLAKCLFIKALATHSKVMVVGDDWQSIYKFSGANLEVFRNFKNYFPYTKTFKLENTYRNSQELLTMMSNFIMKNEYQLKKNLSSSKSLSKPIKIYYYTDNQTKILGKILDSLKDDFIILGRNNENVNIVPKKYRNKFMTVHKSKGLESEVVIIINLEDNVLGFPSKLASDEVLRCLLPKEDALAEERRLFYVALTRTKTYNILLVNKDKPSIFVNEIIKDNKGLTEYKKIK